VEQQFHIMSQPARTNSGTHAIERAAQVLVRVVESDEPLGVGELAETTGLPKSTTSRLVSALERQGLLQRAGGLRPGPVLMRFAQRGLGAALVELADDALRRLADESGEPINLAVPTPVGVEHLSQRDSRHFVGVVNWVGKRVPPHSAANGKVFLAFGAVPVPASLEQLTPRTIVDRAALEQELERVRASGYATAVDELELGLSAIASPVRGAGDEVVAALSISAPSIRLPAERIRELLPALLEQARALSARLGTHELGGSQQ
jgi:IclR family transcriptional regulator, acetate operon repressor